MAIEVGVLIGSKHDFKEIEPCFEILKALRVGYEFSVLSCHRHDAELAAYAAGALNSNVKVFIAAAGMQAGLPGILAAKLKGHGRVVIGVALPSAEFPDAMDALLAIVRCPAGTPVVCAGIGKAGVINAALVAGEILSGMHGNLVNDFLPKYYLDELDKKRPQSRVQKWDPETSAS